jgi:phosphatidylserine/phosphatidylglycerophosphate/cardiolipin synthase-like enzyme
MRSAMFSGKRRLVTGLVAASLLATMVAETGQSPASAKAMSGVLKSNSVATGDYGPVCTTPSATTIKLINTFVARTYSIATLTACANYVVPSTIPTPMISPTARPSSTPTATSSVTPYPAPSLIPLPAANSISYSIGSNPAGLIATISGNKLTVSTKAKAAALVSTLEIVATHAYLDPLEGSYEYMDTTAISVPVSVKPASPPTCRSFTATTIVNKAVTIPLEYDSTREGGCKASPGYGSLTYKISKVKYSKDKNRKLRSDLKSYKFSPRKDWISPSDNSRKASFDVVATDEFGQKSIALTKANEPVLDLEGNQVSAATFYLNVNKARKCTKSEAETSNGVIFNDPRYRASKYTITNEIIRLVDCAKPGSHIAMSWFSMTDENFVNHLIQAHRAGVHVRVLLNSHAIQPRSASFTAYTTLKKQLGTKMGSATAAGGTGSWVSYCKSGCLTPKAPKGLKFPNESEGEYPALHSKFFMFSELVNGDSVVGISSINPTYAQSVAGFNNSSIIVNDAKLFSSLETYYEDLAVSAKSKGKIKAKSYRNLESKSKTTTYTAFPRLGSGGETDNITQTLNKVKCVYTENGEVKRTKIYVNMFVFTRNSPAMKLWRLAHASNLKGGGCEVHIIYTDMDQRIRALNTRTNQWGYIPNAGKVSNYGVADCLSTPATTKGGKVQRLTAPGKSWSASENRYVTTSVCKFGKLQGKMPTINVEGGYCWLKSKSSVSGGSIEGCVSTPLGITAFDPADQRAKLEPIADSAGKKWYSHQKYILIDGVVEDVRTKLVISGTPNISSPGLRWNDEILTFSTNAKVYSSYLGNYELMRKAIKDRKAPISNPAAVQATWK